MSLAIQSILPSTLMPAAVASASQHIIRKRKVEILPQNQIVYKYSGSNRLVFNINSASEFLDCQNSFLKFEFRAYGTTATDTVDPFLSLATGGSHALFKEVIVRLQNGTEIARVSDYHKHYAMMSSITEPADHVKNYGWAYGDSLGRYREFDPSRVKNAHSGAQVTAANTRVIQVATNANPSVLTNQYNPLVPENLDTLTGLPVIASAALAYTEAGLRTASGGWASARVAACIANGTAQDAALAQTGKVLCMTIPLSILQMHQFLPLPFIQGGLQIEFVLENPVHSLCVNDNTTPVASSSVDYSIVNPRYICQMVQPSEEIMSSYMGWYKSDKLVYPYIKVSHFMNTHAGGAGDINIVMAPSVRSAVFVATIVQNINANTTGHDTTAADNAYIYDGIGTFLKTNISSYQYKVGSDSYPEAAVQMPDTYNAEAFMEAQRAFGHLGSVLFTPRTNANDWWSVNTDSGVAAETKKLVLAYDLARDGSIFSGVDISIAPFTAVFGSTAYTLANPTRYLHTYLYSNAVCKIGQSGCSILN
jgi:hypothetical protein